LAAKEVGAKIVAITCYLDSDLRKMADYVVEIRGERRLRKRDIAFSDRSLVSKSVLLRSAPYLGWYFAY